MQLLLRPEEAACNGVHAQCLKKIRAHIQRFDPFGLSLARQIDAAFVIPEDDDLLEDIHPIPPPPGAFLRVWILPVNTRPGDKDQLRRIAIGQRTNQHAIDDRKDRRVSADPQRQRQHSHGQKTGLLQQQSRAEADVLPKLIDQAKTAEVSIRLLHLLHSAEAAPRRPPRFLFAHPLANVLRRFHLQVKAHLGVHLAFDLPAPQARAKAMK